MNLRGRLLWMKQAEVRQVGGCCSELWPDERSSHRMNKAPDRTNRRGGDDVPGRRSYGTSVIPLLASWHANTNTHTHTHTHRPDSLLGQMASWWGAARSSTEGLVGFMNHDLHASLLLTPDSTCTQEGWTGIRSMCVCECVWCGGGVVIVEMCRGDYAYSVLTDWLTEWLTDCVCGGRFSFDLASVETVKVKKCMMNTAR